MAAKYTFTTTEILRTILNLQCAIGTEGGLRIDDLKNGKNVDKRNLRLSNMRVILWALQQYNIFYYAEDSINCLTIDQTGILIQRAKQYSQECNCNSPTRPITVPDFYY